MYSPIELAAHTVSFRPDLNVMVVRWRAQAPLAAVQADYAKMLAAAEACGFSDWLLDMRRRENVTAELSAWVSQVFCPVAVARLAPHRVRMAVLRPPARREASRTNPKQKQPMALSADPAQPYDVRLFDDEREALGWLSPLLDQQWVPTAPGRLPNLFEPRRRFGFGFEAAEVHASRIGFLHNLAHDEAGEHIVGHDDGPV
jgi:hypothetical protein